MKLGWDSDDIKQVHNLSSVHTSLRLTTGLVCKSTTMTCWPGRVSAVIGHLRRSRREYAQYPLVYYTGIFLSTETLQGLKFGLGFS